MATGTDPAAHEIQGRAQPQKGLLRFITCGSVDDGKSTLIGRLLFDSKLLFADQVAALASDSKTYGTCGDGIDYALLLDGLQAEREQGITIDVAYRYFETAKRKFIVADTPGHEQYTRNMVTGASTADLAILVVDASKGLRVQTRRHTVLLSLIGIRQVVLAVNKMDTVGHSREVFDRIAGDYREFAAGVSLSNISVLPMAAVTGDNVTRRSTAMAWYTGPTLLELLESAPLEEQRTQTQPFRMPVQWVIRTDQGFRGFAGMIASGAVRPGQRIRVQPSGRDSTVARIVSALGDLPQAVAHQSVTLTLTDEIDVSRGDLLSSVEGSAQVADQFEASLVWLGDRPMLRGRSYLMKIAAKTVTATVLPLKYKLSVDTLAHVAANTLEMNEIGVAALELDRRIAFDPYLENRDTGGFILIDRMTHHTVAAGMLHFALRRAHNLVWQTHDVDRAARASQKGQRPCVVWFTGLSGSGKSTIANLVEKKLFARGHHTYLLDGDNVRHGLNKDLGFTDADRVENIRRVAEVAALMVDAGLIVLTAFISPFRSERHTARTLLANTGFIEVHVDAPLALAELRDPKGLYRKARRGELTNFTGIDSPYEPPENPELRLDTGASGPDACAEAVLAILDERGILPSGD